MDMYIKLENALRTLCADCFWNDGRCKDPCRKSRGRHLFQKERRKTVIWHTSNRADPLARDVADRHYNRQKPGTPQFVPPGRCCVFYAENEKGKAFWVTSFPFAQYVKHEWAGAWVCSAFRNEGAGIASEMILDAVAATRAFFGEPPELGMITFIDTKKVKPTYRHGVKTWGLTYEKAGFRKVGKTKGGLLAFQLLPEDMPPAQAALPPIREDADE